MRNMRDKAVASVMGLVVGDALGVPVEFMSRSGLDANPVRNMRSFGTHEQPIGTWSDDSSMVAATMEWMNESDLKGDKFINECDYESLMKKFVAWLKEGKYTPYDETFDSGVQTSKAIYKSSKGIPALECGEANEFDNGNGSLMRILPAAIMVGDDRLTKERVKFIFDMSALTHAHARSKIGCLIYSHIITTILDMKFAKRADLEVLKESLTMSISEVREFLADANNTEGLLKPDELEELKYYERLFDIDVFSMSLRDEIKSSGYIVDTLEAAIYCLVKTKNYRDCLLMAVNLGQDTDTVGAVAGGLAGCYYGYDGIPKEWLKVIPKREWLEELAAGIQ